MIEKDLELMEQGAADTESMQILSAMQPWETERYSRTDMGNANLFADFFGDRARYMKQKNCWYVYDGRVWQPDEGELAVRALIKQLAQLLARYCSRISNDALRESMNACVMRWHSRRGRHEILNDAQDVHPLLPEWMDENPMYLNCLNGTLDLSTGVMHPHDPADLQSRICGADYIRGVRCERWEQFVLEVMRKSSGQLSADDETEALRKAKWLQRIMGYAMTGDTRLECLFMLYGASTRNGKSTMMETMLKLMGSYGVSIQPESLGLRPGGAAPSEDIARLEGARFVSASEPDKRLQLSASLLKTMTGNDTITARALYQNSFQYKPRFKLFLNTNHLPSAGDITLFESGRVQLLPFERHFDPHEQDRGLKNFFSQPLCLTGILNWCVEGLQEFQEHGFSFGETPESARRMLALYRSENDHTGCFVQECLKPEDGSVLRSSDVYKRYVKWCEENGVKQETAVVFRRELSSFYRLGKARIKGGTPTNVVFDCVFHAN